MSTSIPDRPPAAELLSPEQLAEIRARLEMATAGPWEATITGVYAPQPDGVTRIVVEDDEAEWYDLDFAAHARDDVLALLGEVARLRAEVAGLDDLRIRAIDKGDQVRDEAARLWAERNTALARAAGLEGAARTAAVLLRSVADRADSGQRIDPAGLQAAARALDDIAGPQPAAEARPAADPDVVQAARALASLTADGHLPTADTIGPDQDGARLLVVHLTPVSLADWDRWMTAVHAQPDGITYQPAYATACGSYAGVPVTLVGHGVTDLTAAAMAAESGQAPAAPVVYQAEHHSIPLGTYTTETDARAHCEQHLVDHQPGAVGRWISDDLSDPDAARTIYLPDGEYEEIDTGYTVRRIEVHTAYDPDGEE